MPRLRMKDTTTRTRTEEAVLKASKRAASRKSKSKRHHQQHYSEESISPPRNRNKSQQQQQQQQQNDDDFDESSLPPSQAYKKTRTSEEEEEEEREFEEKLKQASYVDQGIGCYEENDLLYYSTSYSSAAGNAAGVSSNKNRQGGNEMDEEEYAEYIRAGMWRLQNKERLEFLEKQEKFKKQQEEKIRLDFLEKEKKSKLKTLKLEQKKRDQLEKDKDQARERYKLGWNKLQKLDNTSSLRFTDFVWPIFPPFALPPISWPRIQDLTKEAIDEFLLPPSTSGVASVEEEDERRGKMRSAVLSYHPDRFERLVKKIKQDDDKEDGSISVQERVRELGLRVSQVLNDLLKEEKKRK
ncbi:hypothetical protein JCM3765_003688 [Sporobolomyces pararoseus]